MMVTKLVGLLDRLMVDLKVVNLVAMMATKLDEMLDR
jgi:hypothetical protein